MSDAGARLEASVELLREVAVNVLDDRMAAYQTHDMARLPRDLTTRIRAFLAEGPAGPAPGTVQATGAPVHLLVGGVAACGAGVPLCWPEGERWTDRALVATCAACRQWARATDWHRERG